MNYLLDTHVFLWALSEPERLPENVAAAIRNPANAAFISAVSGVEIAIKQALGKLRAPSDLENEIEARGFQHLPLTYAHSARLVELPLYHQDPFDRMLVAQTLEESLTLITRDRKICAYPVKLLFC